MGYKILIDYLIAKENPIEETKAAIYLNGRKHSNQIFKNKTTMKTLLTNASILQKNKLYEIDLFYKDKGIYEPTTIHSTFAFLDTDGQIALYVTKSDILESVYMKRIGDYSLFGDAKKKILVNQSNLVFYQIDISSTEIYQRIDMCMSKPLSLVKVLTKKLSKYNFTIEDTKYEIQGPIHRIKVFVSIQGTKSIISRLFDSL